MPRLTDLTAATTPLDGTEVLYVVQGGNSRRTVTQDIAGLVSGRNLIINGDFRINQRAYVSGTNTGSANQFTLDRWFVITSGQNVTFTGNDSGRTVTAPAGGLAQVIEGANIKGGTYVVNWTGAGTVTVGGTARTKGETFTLTANTNVTVVLVGAVTELQIEKGTIPTPFEWRDIGDELRRCQRYYRQSLAWVYAASGGIPVGVYFSNPMRANPTISGGGAGFTLQPGTISPDGFFCFQTTAAAQTLIASAELTA